MAPSLREKSCVPCRGGTAALTIPEAEALRVETPGWLIRDAPVRIEREWRFRDFASALAFVQMVAGLAETEGHHPDIHFGWGYVRLSLHTHVIGGLHENDFILAAKIDALSPAGG